MLCLECGHLNQPYATICEKCSSIIPDRELPPPMDERLDAILDAVKKVSDRQISSGEFRNFLVRHEEACRTLLEETLKMEIPPDQVPEMAGEMSMGTGGLRLYLEAFLEMHRFLDTRQEVYLQRGVAMARDANNRLNEAMRMNWERFRSLQETAEEFIRTQIGF